MKFSRVLKLLSKLDVAKGTGLDQICNKILKFAAPLIYRQLTDLFNLSLKSLEFQFLMTGSWQKFSLGSKIKVGQRKNPNNHGPISAINRIQGV